VALTSEMRRRIVLAVIARCKRERALRDEQARVSKLFREGSEDSESSRSHELRARLDLTDKAQ
jgi:hypothetical protein